MVTFTVSEKSAAAGKTLAQLDLRARTGATVIAVRRGEHSSTLPAGDQSLEPGDLLALTGTQAAVDSAQSILRDGVLPDRAEDEG